MKNYDIKITLDFKDKEQICCQLNDTTDEKVIINIIEQLLLRDYQDMDDIKISEEILLYSLIEYKVKELYSSLKDELEAYFKNKRPCHEHLLIQP